MTLTRRKLLGSAAHVCQEPVGTNPMGLEDPFWRELAESPLMRGWERAGALVSR